MAYLQLPASANSGSKAHGQSLASDPDDCLPRLGCTPICHETLSRDGQLTDAEEDSLWAKQHHHRRHLRWS